MNNIEIEALKRDLQEYIGFSNEELESIYGMREEKLLKLKNSIMKAKDKSKREEIKQRIEEIFNKNPELAKKKIIFNSNEITNPTKKTQKSKSVNIGKSKNQSWKESKFEPIEIIDRKPKILFITDVKGWAWWIKSEYLKKYLSDEFDIDIINVISKNGGYQLGNVNQKKYDLYFTYGFSYIDFLTAVPLKRKITGVTAHRARNVIFPKMKLAGHQHANSILLLKELQNMGFQRTFYVPNGVDEELFKPYKPIKKEGDIIVGHVGKETPLKGQKEFILPAVQMAGAKSYTNLRTWKDRLPHTEMPKIYNEMDVFVVASTEDGTPNPALEAAACGRPIISNAIGNMPEFIEDGYNGFIVPKKINAYVEKINYFKNNRDELIRMGENARKTVEEGWTWKIQSENYRKMFRTIFGMEK